MLRVAALVLFATGCIIPIAAPSTRVEGGYLVNNTTSGRGTVRAGVNVVGNRADEDATWDLGAGYVGVASGETDATGMTVDGGIAKETIAAQQGAYFEGSFMKRISPNARIGIGPGVEVLVRGNDRAIAPVVYARASLEAFSYVNEAGSSSERCGAAVGAWRGQMGFGTFIDVQKPLADGGVSVVAGVSMRLPAFAGVAMVLPGCK